MSVIIYVPRLPQAERCKYTTSERDYFELPKEVQTWARDAIPYADLVNVLEDIVMPKHLSF